MRVAVDKGFFVLDDIWVVDVGQDAHLVDGILFVFQGLRCNLHFLECIGMPVFNPSYFVYT